MGVFVISETAIDDSFPLGSFKCPTFSTFPFRRDHDKLCWGTAYCLRKGIPTKYSRNNVEGIYIELNLRRKSWLLCYTYNTNVNITEKHPDVLERSLDMYFAKYKNLMIICDLNADVKSELYETFL